MKLLRDDERMWRVKQIEKLLDIILRVPSDKGDISSLAFKVQNKLRDQDGWWKYPVQPHKLLKNMLDMTDKHGVKLSLINVLMKSILNRADMDIIILARQTHPKEHMDLYQRWYAAKKTQ
mmetsp:Transcript_20935/g.25733  ORF Transcript_20935/g.25733 Transcript_20935/m.25733 type:complete len:120 (+) Transcript_20935:429-788(+)